MVRNLRLSSISAGLTSEAETDSVRERVLWLSSLSKAKITRWGGMISTPDTVLQAVVKRALVDSGCPLELATQLISNSHERRYSGNVIQIDCTANTANKTPIQWNLYITVTAWTGQKYPLCQVAAINIFI